MRAKAHEIDEPPVDWPSPSSGFEADPFSPAGQLQGIWRLTGRGSDAGEADAKSRRRPIGRVGALILKLLGYHPGEPGPARRGRRPARG